MAELAHPDFFEVGLPADKTQLSVEQIRELAAQFSLHSHQGGAKVALIAPADRMTANAANALLKTLEEPAGDSCLILVADRLHTLPATILSRCVQVAIPLPERDASLEWLRAVEPEADWASLLALAGGAPLLAEEYRAAGRQSESEALQADLESLLEGRTSAVEAAARWARGDVEFALHWLRLQVDALIRYRMSGRDAGLGVAAIDRIAGKRIDLKNLFCYLDRLNRLFAQPSGSRNDQLAIEALLIAWSNGLSTTMRDSAIVPRA